jgi:hypothetical protein
MPSKSPKEFKVGRHARKRGFEKHLPRWDPGRWKPVATTMPEWFERMMGVTEER